MRAMAGSEPCEGTSELPGRTWGQQEWAPEVRGDAAATSVAPCCSVAGLRPRKGQGLHLEKAAAQLFVKMQPAVCARAQPVSWVPACGENSSRARETWCVRHKGARAGAVAGGSRVRRSRGAPAAPEQSGMVPCGRSRGVSVSSPAVAWLGFESSHPGTVRGFSEWYPFSFLKGVRRLHLIF